MFIYNVLSNVENMFVLIFYTTNVFLWNWTKKAFLIKSAQGKELENFKFTVKNILTIFQFFNTDCVFFIDFGTPNFFFISSLTNPIKGSQYLSFEK